jgi:hypothetical protein
MSGQTDETDKVIAGLSEFGLALCLQTSEGSPLPGGRHCTATRDKVSNFLPYLIHL